MSEMSAAEQFVLTISEKGFGKRTSSYEYRTTGRGGKGIVAMAITEKNGRLVASFPVEESDQIMLVTDGGQLIRCPVDGIRIAGRSTQGVIVFSTAEGEHVASVERLTEESEESRRVTQQVLRCLGAGGAPQARRAKLRLRFLADDCPALLPKWHRI